MKWMIDDDTAANEFKSYVKDNNIKIVRKSTDGSVLFASDGDKYVLKPKYKTILESEKKSEYSNHLVFGRDETERITSVEVQGENLVIHKLGEEPEFRKAVYWAICNRKIDKYCKPLKGNLRYKYIRFFDSKADKYEYINHRKKLDIYHIWNDVEANMIYYGITLFKGLTPKEIPILSFDIEGRGLVRNSDSTAFVITNTFRHKDHQETVQFRVDEYEDQYQMIRSWCDYVREKDPIVITGHNLFGYDLDYLRHIMDQIGEGLPLGKDGSEAVFSKKSKSYRVDGSQTWEYTNCNITGRHIVDGMFLATKYDIGRNYPSWKLKDIIEYEGLVKEGRQFYDASKIGKNWDIPEEREKIIEYCRYDGLDSLQLFDLMIPSYFYTAQSIPKSFQVMMNGATGSWINSVLVRSYLQEGYSIPKASPHKYVAGGMSYGVPGVYKNVSKWDAKSYYPSTILTFNIYDKRKDPKAHFLEIVKYFTYKRFEQKDKYEETGDKKYDDLQAASKIFINSAYGVLGTKGLNFNSFDNAALITKCCRKGLQKCIKWATGRSVDYWWGISDKLYKKLTVPNEKLSEALRKYENKVDIVADNGEETTLWVPKGKSGKDWKTCYKHSRTATQDFEDYGFIDAKAEWSYEEMPKHDWELVNIDTDSLSFAKKDGSSFTDDEYKMIEEEINKIMYSAWSDDGMFDRFLVIRAKNYAMIKKGKNKIKLKGSSISDSKKETALNNMINDILDSLIYEKGRELDIYHNYIKEAYNIKDISRWVVKKNITKSVLNPERANEQKVLDALEGRDVQEGDKVYMFSDIDGEKQKVEKGELVYYKNGEPNMVPNRILRVMEDFDGSYDRMHYIGRVYDTISIFESVLDMNKFIKYSNKSNEKKLEELVGGINESKS